MPNNTKIIQGEINNKKEILVSRKFSEKHEGNIIGETVKITLPFVSKYKNHLYIDEYGEVINQKNPEIVYIEDSFVITGVFDYIESKMPDFFKNNENNLEKCEFLIPDILDMASKEGFAQVKVLHTDATWYGVTYKEDKEYVKTSIQKLIDENEYPNNLWG